MKHFLRQHRATILEVAGMTVFGIGLGLIWPPAAILAVGAGMALLAQGILPR